MRFRRAFQRTEAQVSGILPLPSLQKDTIVDAPPRQAERHPAIVLTFWRSIRSGSFLLVVVAIMERTFTPWPMLLRDDGSSAPFTTSFPVLRLRSMSTALLTVMV